MKTKRQIRAMTLSLDASLCVGCGRCVEVCPHGVFETSGPLAVVVHGERCMECGACALNCPEGAITARKGVGCAVAILTGILRGTEPTCGCGEEEGGACCG